MIHVLLPRHTNTKWFLSYFWRNKKYSHHSVQIVAICPGNMWFILKVLFTVLNKQHIASMLLNSCILRFSGCFHDNNGEAAMQSHLSCKLVQIKILWRDLWWDSEVSTVTVSRHLLALGDIACDFKTHGCWENGSDDKLLCATKAEEAVREELLKIDLGKV